MASICQASTRRAIVESICSQAHIGGHYPRPRKRQGGAMHVWASTRRDACRMVRKVVQMIIASKPTEKIWQTPRILALLDTPSATAKVPVAVAGTKYHSPAKLTLKIARDEGRSSGFFSRHLPTKSLNSCLPAQQRTSRRPKHVC